VEKGSVPSILVQGLDPRTVERLKERARVNGRSLQQEIKQILERAAGTLTMRLGATALGAVEAPAQPVVVHRQRAIDPRGSQFPLSAG
jgi:plasmid stability protein